VQTVFKPGGPPRTENKKGREQTARKLPQKKDNSGKRSLLAKKKEADSTNQGRSSGAKRKERGKRAPRLLRQKTKGGDPFFDRPEGWGIRPLEEGMSGGVRV